MRKFRFSAAISAAALLLASCGGGGDSNDFGGTPSPSPAPSPTPAPIDGTGGAYTPPAQESLSVTDVQKKIGRASCRERVEIAEVAVPFETEREQGPVRGRRQRGESA